MLEIRSLSVGYGHRLVLKDVNLTVSSGEVVALIGPNGAGKTTLIRAVSGVLQPREGELRVAGRDLLRLSTRERASMLAVVPQAKRMPDGYTVWQTVMLGRTPYLGWLGRLGAGDREHLEKALEHTHLLEMAQRPVGELSGGEQQRVLLARALAQDTPILLLDEPTSQLDIQHQSGLLNLVHSQAGKKGLAVLMALHDLNLAGLYADRVALLVGGRIQHIGKPEDVLTSERLTEVYQTPVQVVLHPQYGTPLVLPDGRAISQDVQSAH